MLSNVTLAISENAQGSYRLKSSAFEGELILIGVFSSNSFSCGPAGATQFDSKLPGCISFPDLTCEERKGKVSCFQMMTVLDAELNRVMKRTFDVRRIWQHAVCTTRQIQNLLESFCKPVRTIFYCHDLSQSSRTIGQ